MEAMMGSEWKPIDTAPKDGSAVHVKRIFEGEMVFEGEAAWRTVTFPAFVNGRYGLEPDYTATGWMKVDSDHRVPEPTHWRSVAPPGELT